MADRHFDVVVVGARCAGAALATFLARSGARVLVVDRSPLPSDQVLSTHTIHPPDDGITEALIQARGLAGAIAEGGDDALHRWWRARDVEALPGYYWGRDEGSLGSPGELEEIVVRKVGEDEGLQRLMVRLPEHECSPYDALPVKAVIRALLGALIRGRFGVIPEFVAQGRRITKYKQVMKERTELMEDAAG